MSSLCTAILANLQTEPWTLSVIQALVNCSLTFRDAVLDLEPLLLDTLLNKAVGSDEAYDQVGKPAPKSDESKRRSVCHDLCCLSV